MNQLSGIQTISLHAGQTVDPATQARAVPIYQTTSYVFKNSQQGADLFALREFGNIYSRLTNPTDSVLEERLAALEGGTAALTTASGMSAIFLAVITLVKAGDHIISSSSIYGGTQVFFEHTLPRFGVEVTFLKEFTAAAIRQAIKPNTKLVFGETIGNPDNSVPDFTAIAAAAHAEGIPFVIDNTFAPILVRPIDFGADIVIHSLTKWIGGHGTTLGGVIIDSGKFDWSQSPRFPEFITPDPSYHGLVYWDAFGNVPGLGNIAFAVKVRAQGLRNIGPCLSPLSAFLLLQGVETLPLRIKAHSENALQVAQYLKNHPQVAWVNYLGLPDHPYHKTAEQYFHGGFGSVLGFGVRGGSEAAIRFIDHVKLASNLANVGDAKTLIIHPWSTTHSQLTDEAKQAAGIDPEFIRLSVGLENVEDIIADFDQAFASIR